MREFMQSFLGNVADTLPTYVKNRLDSMYKPADTMNQYLEHFNNFRKTASMMQPVRWVLNCQFTNHLIWILYG